GGCGRGRESRVGERAVFIEIDGGGSVKWEAGKVRWRRKCEVVGGRKGSSVGSRKKIVLLTKKRMMARLTDHARDLV
ncbi:hypothetical protein GW17_00021434, partial [Ensete ventricosum]